jgi:hypothetical protein
MHSLYFENYREGDVFWGDEDPIDDPDVALVGDV